MFYLDNAATTPVLPEVLEKGLPYLNEKFANPSSIYSVGVEVGQAVKDARQQIAESFAVKLEHVIFGSCGTEANTLAILGAAYSEVYKGHQYIFSAFEHPSVLETRHILNQQGSYVDLIQIKEDGSIDLEHFESLVGEDTRCVSCMIVNNEIGTRQPIEAIGEILKKKAPKAVFHVDATQGLGKVPLPKPGGTVDCMTISGHKVGAPKGIGALILMKPLHLNPVFRGGNQEFGLRSGTENVFGIICLAEAVRIAVQKQETASEQMEHYKQNWLSFVKAQCPDVFIYESPHVLPYYMNVGIPGIPAEVLLHHLEAEGICVSAGAACSSRKQKKTSRVLEAIQLRKDLLHSMVRMSFSKENSEEDQEALLSGFKRAIHALQH